jgi:signal transduction histidine kinase
MLQSGHDLVIQLGQESPSQTFAIPRLLLTRRARRPDYRIHSMQRGRWPAKRMAFALALTLGPTLVLAYLGYRSLADRDRSLRITYSAAANLIRDRLADEMRALEAQVPARVPSSIDESRLEPTQAWLRSLEPTVPWARDLVVVYADGRVVTPVLYRGWSRTPRTGRSAELSAAVDKAEAAEFRGNNLEGALQEYRHALTLARGAGDRAFVRSRIARTLAKLQRLEAAIEEYQTVRSKSLDATAAHGLPLAILALEEIVDAYTSLRQPAERDRAAAELVEEMLERPWDLDDGYRYHLKRGVAVGAELPSATVERAASVLSEATAVEAVKPLPGVAAPDERPAVRYRVRPDHVANTLLAKASAGVDLGSSTRVTIEPPGGPAALSLFAVDVGGRLEGWRLSVVDADGRTLDQISRRERWTYGGVLALVLIVLVAGVVFTTRAWAREAELSKLRTDFVSSVSHELRTPLALIRMYGETLESGLVTDAGKRQEFSGIIRRESERLTQLINNVLDTAKIDAGTKSFALARTDLVALVQEAVDAYAPLFTRLRFAVEARLPDAPVIVSLDRDAVAQALVNLFQNAIRYSKDTRTVTVAIEAHHREVVVTVADRGVGIPAAELPRIFDRFYRSPSAAHASPSSSGLGLSIVKHVMQAHGGRVEVLSTVGQGSTFTLVFPAEAAT